MSELIDRHIKAIRADGLADTTIASREELLWRLERDLPYGLEEATTEELQEWLGNPKWSPKTRETYWCHIVPFYRWCTKGRSPIFDYDPSADMRRPRVGRHLPRVATDDQLALALANLSRPALRAVVLAAGVGMRASEVADAERHHFTRERVVIHGKGDKMRSVPMTGEVWTEIRNSQPGRLITNRGRPVNAEWVSRTVSHALSRIGLPITLHYFRGSYATRLRRAGVDAFAIAELLGHSSVATTQTYIAIVDADLDAAVAKLPPLPMQLEPVSTRLEPTAEAA